MLNHQTRLRYVSLWGVFSRNIISYSPVNCRWRCAEQSHAGLKCSAAECACPRICSSTSRHGIVCAGYKKQFFQYSRSSGKFVGRAVGFIRQKRDQVFTSSGQQKELTALQQQLEEAMSQMQHIRYDIRSSARIMPSQCASPLLLRSNRDPQAVFRPAEPA